MVKERDQDQFGGKKRRNCESEMTVPLEEIGSSASASIQKL